MTEQEQARFDELCWKYVDQVISHREMEELEAIMQDSEQAREQYVGVVVLHAELSRFFEHARGEKEVREMNLLSALMDEDQFNFAKQKQKQDEREALKAKASEPLPEKLAG